MYLSQLYVKDYRNYSQEHLKFNPNLNLLIGLNAQGKTNILEAIYLLGTGGSHRSNVGSDLIKWDADSFYVKGELLKREQSYKLELSLNQRDKIVKVDTNRLKKVSDLLGYLNVVIFSPEDLNLVKGSPNLRRKFIDLEISQISSYYKHQLSKYKEVLKHRNNLLKEIRDKKGSREVLEILNHQLIDLGSRVIIKRIDSLNKLSILAKLIQRRITSGVENLELKYDSQLIIDNQSSYEGVKKELARLIEEKEESDIYRGVTTVGPHRDDIALIVNNIDIRKFGSQGQQRTTALALKLSELEFMKAEIGEYPVLLLDDVFSELDYNRRSHLLDLVQNKIQTFITSTDLKSLGEIKSNYNLFEIKNGSVIKEER